MDSSMMKRLALVRHLFNVGVEQSHQAEPLNSVSILSFHDAVELFLQLTTEHHGISKNDRAFMDYWNPISSKIGEPLHQRESMKRMNRARSQLKHHGMLPAPTDVESFRASTRNFFIENTPLVFGRDFDSISLVDFVSSQGVREVLSSAEESIKQDRLKYALKRTSLAFDTMVDEYVGSRPRPVSSPFRFESGFEPSDSVLGKDEDMVEFIDGVWEAITPMQKAITILCLGLDYRKYVKFETVVRRGISDPKNKDSEIGNREIDYVTFCFNYVIESAIHLQNFDHRVDARTSNRTLPEYLNPAQQTAKPESG